MTVDFSIFKPWTWRGYNKDTENRAESTVVRGAIGRRDLSYPLSANEELTTGLYHGTYPGLEKASPLARIPINIRVSMIGIPTFTSKDERTQDKIDEIIALMNREIKIIKWAYLNNGTTWVYPLWDSKNVRLVWRVLKDTSVSDVIVDANSEKIVQINTEEEITLATGKSQRTNTRKLVQYDYSKVAVSYSNPIGGLGEVTMRNTAGLLPVKFAHDCDDISGRGHSLHEPVLCDYKDYHEIDANVSRTVARFRPKQKQKVANGQMASWMKNNSVDSCYDPLKADLIINQGDEDTDYLHLPGDATAAAEKTLERIFYKISQGTNTPQIFFGEIATGNHASTDNDMQMMIVDVESCRDEITESFKAVIVGSLRLMSIVDNYQYDTDIEASWNKLSALSEQDKWKIFLDFVTACSRGLGSGALGIEMMYKLYQQNYPDIAPLTLEDFKKDLIRAGNLMQFMKQDYATGESMIDSMGGAEDKLIDETIK